MQMRAWLVVLVVVLSLGLVACSSSDDNPPADGDAPDGDLDGDEPDGDLDGDEPDGDGDGDGDGDADGDADEEIDPGPGDFTLSDVSIVANPNCTLSAYVMFKTDVETTAELIVTGAKSFTTPRSQTPGKDHEMNLLGLYPDSTFTVTIKAYDSEGRWVLSEEQTHTSGSLPDDFPPMEVVTSKPESMQPGVTVFNLYRWTPGTDIGWALLLAVDETGRIVWYHRENAIIFSIHRNSQGHFQYNYANLGIATIDVMGNIISRWLAFSLGVDTIHHDVHELANGHYLALSTELQVIDGYPKEGGGTEELNVIGDVIVELDEEGKLVKKWSLFDYLDPMRTGEGFEDPFWNQNYMSVDSTRDWTHANALLYDASDNSFIVSVRHQDWILKISMATDELVWKLGPEGDFTLSDGLWQYHQHAPKLLDNGHLLVYDNGNGRDGLADGETPFTRMVEYAYDEDAMTVEQVWEYRGQAAYYAQFVGDVSRLANGNTMITDGGMVDDATQSEYEVDNLKWARISEISGGDDPQNVFELVIRDDSETTGYTIYRATRLDSLYP